MMISNWQQTEYFLKHSFDESHYILQYKIDYNILETYNDQIIYFFNCINNSTLPMNDINESFETLKIALHEEIRK
jgi:hypothetical protein